MEITARIPTDESRQYQQDQRAQKAHVAKAAREFKKLLKLLQPYADNAKAEFPARDKQSRSRRARAFVKAVKALPLMTDYLDAYIGSESQHPKAYSWRSAVIYQARDVLTQGKSIRDALVEVDKQSFKGFQAITMAESQAPLREAIPSEFRDFLPDNIVVEVDKSGTIERITDRFENEHLTLGKKIDKMHSLVRDYNKIAKQVKRDLKSGDEIIKLSALITAIIMETGIRPGKEGNAAFKTVDGEKVEIETFGAITLGPSHVKFVRDNFAEIEFVGKKGGHNTATLSDAQIIKLLKAQTTKAKGGKYIFVTSKGQKVVYSDLQRYFRERFKGVSPTDFRKLRATDAVLTALRAEQTELYKKIQGFKETAKTDLKSRVVGAIVETLNKAIDVAQAALSHDSATTTRKAYINPEIILRFLSTGQVEDSLEKAILQGKPTLSFDPEVFATRAMGKVGSSMPKSGTSLQDILDELEDELDEVGIKTSSSRVAARYTRNLLTQKIADQHRNAGTFTEQEWKTHQEKYPGAVKSDHTITKGDGGKSESKGEPTAEQLKAAGIPEGVKPSKSVKELAQSDKGKDMLAAVTDKKIQKSFAAKIKEHANPKKILKKLRDSTIREVRNVVTNTPQILMDCIKEGRKPSKDAQKWPKGCDEPGSKTKCSVGESSEEDILYGSAVYAGGIAVATALTPVVGAAGVAMVGAKAFLNSLTLHIGIGAYSSAVDMKLLHAEVGQDAATVAGGSMAESVAQFGTGTIDGLGTLFESAVNLGKSLMASEDFEELLQDQEMIRLANEGDGDKVYGRFVKHVTDYAVAKFEKGLSDEEIKSILEHGG